MEQKRLALVAEDSKPNRDVAVLHLKRHGFDVVAFEDGAQAWKFLQERTAPVDLILSDYLMPELNGIELLTKVKASPLHGLTPFVMITAMRDKETMVASIHLGIDAFVVKPIMADTIARVLARIAEPKNSKARLLVVDDDPVFLLLTSKLLIAEGYSVEKSSGSAHGLDRIITAIPNFDLVISDVHMPDGSGFDLFSSVRTIGIDIPFVLMSGDSFITSQKNANTSALRLKFVDKSQVQVALTKSVSELLLAG